MFRMRKVRRGQTSGGCQPGGCIFISVWRRNLLSGSRASQFSHLHNTINALTALMFQNLIPRSAIKSNFACDLATTDSAASGRCFLEWYDCCGSDGRVFHWKAGSQQDRNWKRHAGGRISERCVKLCQARTDGVLHHHTESGRTTALSERKGVFFAKRPPRPKCQEKVSLSALGLLPNARRLPRPEREPKLDFSLCQTVRQALTHALPTAREHEWEGCYMFAKLCVVALEHQDDGRA